MHFGEYELFPSLIGLSPLPSGHPKTFQRQRVRSSTECYHSFNLPKGRSHGFRISFTPLPGCFSPFPHGTGSLSVTREYLALGDGPPGFRRNFTCSAVLRIHSGENEVLTTGLLPPMAGLSRPLHLPRSFVTPYRVSYNPKRQASWFGLIPFRSPLLRESHLLSLPPGT